MTNAFMGIISLKYLSLITLTLQNSLLTVLLHYSRSIPTEKLYSAPAAVLLNEILKCSISLAVAVYNSSIAALETKSSNHKVGEISPLLSPNTEPLFPPHDPDSSLLTKPEPIPTSRALQTQQEPKPLLTVVAQQFSETIQQIISRDCWKLSIPAILYVIQNNLQFVAASHLDVATFSVTYQLKILTTALFSVLMLRRRLSVSKWISLFFLALGVALVQLQNAPPTHKAAGIDVGDRFIGFVAVTLACFTSGLAGVYFELVLKSSTKVDLWIRNVQLSLFSLLPALFTAFATTSTHGSLFDNFGFWAWATVLTQVFGGLVTALVIKFADNILKGFATSLSIILSTLAGVFLFNAPLPLGSAIGASVVLFATYSYNQSSSDLVSALPVRMPPKAPTWRSLTVRKDA
ncbi:hypothetical protein CROQUDRAFT_68773 [Cronartium quercuum f. sp. fusiforme G11]|uniref:Nucleotide-sugar transporter n=1 Tax=Cronartium quercuum f. sp. fusiforme G11 TaxID=708437 RepID=A0A9P6T6H1_9BASI|nr:hypothetical protein CROQUDRAFT_68773 [Cronartium quercuum f. sp. fusiforme G11]